MGDGDSREKLVQLLVITDGELKMSGDDSRLLVVAGSISRQLEDFSSEVFEDGSQVDWGTGTNSLGIVALAQESVNTTDGELKSSTAGSALCLSLRLASLSAARHFDRLRMCVVRRERKNSCKFCGFRKGKKFSFYMRSSDSKASILNAISTNVALIGASPPIRGRHAKPSPTSTNLRGFSCIYKEILSLRPSIEPIPQINSKNSSCLPKFQAKEPRRPARPRPPVPLATRKRRRRERNPMPSTSTRC